MASEQILQEKGHSGKPCPLSIPKKFSSLPARQCAFAFPANAACAQSGFAPAPCQQRRLQAVWGMRIRLFPALPQAAQAPRPTDAENSAAPQETVCITARPGVNLSRAIWLSGPVEPLPLCAGLGQCGRCRVRFVDVAPLPLAGEEAIFSPEELAHGWRLACRRQIPDGKSTLDLELPPQNLPCPARAPAPSGLSEHSCSPAAPALALAVDLGTTTVYWRALANGTPVAEGGFLNPQAGAGPDVMSRLAEARAGQAPLLAQLVRRSLRAVVQSLATRGTVTRLCVAGNTAMTDILLEKPLHGLCAAPYALSHTGNMLAELEDLPPVYIPPLPAPFVGADVSAGLAALLEKNTPQPFVLADLGTNGELALVAGTKNVWLASVPLGPALEGIGPQCGQLAGPGVVTSFCLTPAGLTPRFWEQSFSAGESAAPAPQARGISATGYLSLLAILLRLQVLDREGHFVPDPPMPLGRRLAAALEHHPGGLCLRLPHGLWLAASDVEELLKVRAVFALALEKLLAAANLAPEHLVTLCLAGALGRHAHPDDLARLGFVPGTAAGKIRAVGNTSLDGAALLLQKPGKAAELATLCAKAQVLSLTDEADFEHNYLRCMRFGT